MSMDNGRKKSTDSGGPQRNSQQDINEENGEGVEKRMSGQSGGGNVRNSKGSLHMQPQRKSGSLGDRRASYQSGSGGARAGSYGTDQGRRSSGGGGYRPSDPDAYYAMPEGGYEEEEEEEEEEYEIVGEKDCDCDPADGPCDCKTPPEPEEEEEEERIEEQDNSTEVYQLDEFMRAKSYFLQTSNKSGLNLYDHLSDVIRKFLDDRAPNNPVDYLEEVSMNVKRYRFGIRKTDVLQDAFYISDPVIGDARRLLGYWKTFARWNEEKNEVDGESALFMGGSFQNLLRLQYYLEQVNIGLPREEMFRLALGIKELSGSRSQIGKLRFWGKIFGIKKNYYVVEAQLKFGGSENAMDLWQSKEDNEEEGEEGLSNDKSKKSLTNGDKSKRSLTNGDQSKRSLTNGDKSRRSLTNGDKSKRSLTTGAPNGAGAGTGNGNKAITGNPEQMLDAIQTFSRAKDVVLNHDILQAYSKTSGLPPDKQADLLPKPTSYFMPGPGGGELDGEGGTGDNMMEFEDPDARADASKWESYQQELMESFPQSGESTTSEVPMEEDGQGVNRRVFYVCNELGEDWVLLPPVTPEQINVSRKIRWFLTGNLNSKLRSIPKFPGKEGHYLKAMLARITAGGMASPKGYFKPKMGEDEIPGEEEDDELEPEDEDLPTPGNDDVQAVKKYRAQMKALTNPNLSFWVHHTACILPQGRTVRWNPNQPKKERKLSAETEEEESEADDDDFEDDEEEGEGGGGNQLTGRETGPPLFTSISQDEAADGRAAWSMVTSSTVFQEFQVVGVRSNTWSGSNVICTSKGKVSNIYLGDGLKFAPITYCPPVSIAVQKEYKFGPELDETPDPSVEQEQSWLDKLAMNEIADVEPKFVDNEDEEEEETGEEEDDEEETTEYDD